MQRSWRTVRVHFLESIAILDRATSVANREPVGEWRSHSTLMDEAANAGTPSTSYSGALAGTQVEAIPPTDPTMAVHAARFVC
jgi:hypothetical protein